MNKPITNIGDAFRQLADDAAFRTHMQRYGHDIDCMSEAERETCRKLFMWSRANPLPRGFIDINALDSIDPVHRHGMRDLDREEADRDDDATEVNVTQSSVERT